VQEIAARDVDKNADATRCVHKSCDQVPSSRTPTILLVDGLNIDPDSQMQVHQQMIHMLFFDTRRCASGSISPRPGLEDGPELHHQPQAVESCRSEDVRGQV